MDLLIWMFPALEIVLGIVIVGGALIIWLASTLTPPEKRTERPERKWDDELRELEW